VSIIKSGRILTRIRSNFWRSARQSFQQRRLACIWKSATWQQ